MSGPNGSTAAISLWLSSPSELTEEAFLTNFSYDDHHLIASEGALWDFKQEWPFSLSDPYFAGICRLICAFSNTDGGIIIFGVHDKKRTSGHNKVDINLDRFRLAVKQSISNMPDLDLKSLPLSERGGVDILLVNRRRQGIPPLTLVKGYQKSPSTTIWVREGHEVVAATPKHFPVVFCRQSADRAPEVSTGVDGSLPPSPASVRRFVGRTEVISQLFEWLEGSDEPRSYIYGKGGSGKTTIAYEFARLIKEYGGSVKIGGADTIDTVVFISAKRRQLIALTGAIGEVESVDFSNERELLSAILRFSDWTSDLDYINSLELNALRSELKDLLSVLSALIIIDDIDTLTTDGVDPGSDHLYRLLCRAPKQSRVLYTLRNAPTQSLTNSVEVPGLSGREYEDFVLECCSQFRVKEPTLAFRDNVLPVLSERRPLVIESIVALVRTAGSYERASELFEQNAGDSIRDYVFMREWDALPAGNLPKLLLCALVEFDRPATFAELQTALQADASKVTDAIHATREMFLEADDAGAESFYALASLTKSFVAGRKNSLEGYSVLRERVKNFKKTAQISNPRVAALVTKVERSLPKRLSEHLPERAYEALKIVTDKNLPPLVTEDPVFRALCGYVYAAQPRPRLADCREAFRYAIEMRHEPDFRYVNMWHSAERRSGAHDGRAIRATEVVIAGRRYSAQEKVNMLALKASNLFARGRERLLTEPTDGMSDLRESLKIHLRVFRANVEMDSPYADRSSVYARNTAYQLLRPISQGNTPWVFFEEIGGILEMPDIYLDPLEDPLIEMIAAFTARTLRPELTGRIKNKAKGLSSKLNIEGKWLSTSVQRRVRSVLETFDARFRTA
ncbi:putative DNA binding domain-containing protein [Tianweitania sp. BSSL-BM11]|uniref:DNA binding domain-containing protein n=1 Tax=Tianweitania aestuarii TaxID=2814886 RepID=A0ABS5RV63_9HYPH|nr:RNA-binding domain-containing protein [Tianweitania aestuarii]MBS9720896.1 putative DNA binding domain-containing protein [Tianweitania aestuarii]